MIIQMFNKQVVRKDGKIYTMKENKNRFFYPDEYMAFFDMLKTQQKHAVKCQINTGARINELRNVKMEDVFFDRNAIIFKVTKCKAAKGEKRGQIRGPIPISSQFARYLKRYAKENKLRPGDYIKILSTPAMNIAIKKAAIKARLKNPGDFSTHTLRKTLETWLLALGVSDLALLRHFGHDIRTAASHYVSPDIFHFKEKEKMRRIIGDLYAK